MAKGVTVSAVSLLSSWAVAIAFGRMTLASRTSFVARGAQPSANEAAMPDKP
jgi:hypothetical protein